MSKVKQIKLLVSVSLKAFYWLHKCNKEQSEMEQIPIGNEAELKELHWWFDLYSDNFRAEMGWD